MFLHELADAKELFLVVCAFRRCGSLIPNDVDQQFRRIGITDSERCGSLGAKRRVF